MGKRLRQDSGKKVKLRATSWQSLAEGKKKIRLGSRKKFQPLRGGKRGVPESRRSESISAKRPSETQGVGSMPRGGQKKKGLGGAREIERREGPNLTNLLQA